MNYQFNPNDNTPNSFDYNNENNPAPKPSQGFAIASLVLGIVSIVCCGNTITAILGLIFGIVSVYKKEDGKGMAIAGVIMSAIALIVGVIVILLYGAAMIAAVADGSYKLY